MAEVRKYPLRNVEVRLKLSDAAPIYSDRPLDTPESAVDTVAKVLAGMDREYVCVVNLDSRMRALGYNVVSIGGLDSCEVPVQNVFKSAILQNSSFLLAFHNHPSGVPEPSCYDDLVTEKLVAAGNLLGIQVKDHIIIAAGNGGRYSYYENRPELFAADGARVGERGSLVREGRRAGRSPSPDPAASRKEQLKEITERLEQGVKELFTSDRYAVWLKTMSTFHHYSFNNTLLIALQAPPGTKYVASYQTWKKLHRHVRRGEKGIKILVPAPVKVKQETQKTDPLTAQPLFDRDGKPLTETEEQIIQHYKIGHVFAYEQTDGEPLPELGPDELTGEVVEYEAMKEALISISPVPVRFDGIKGGAKGYFSYTDQEIVIRSGMSDLQTVKTLIHELVHSEQHDRERGGEEGFRKDRMTKEVESEGVSFSVCSFFNLDVSDYSFPYITGWSSSKDLEELRASMDFIRETSGGIIERLEEKLQLRDSRDVVLPLRDALAKGKKEQAEELLKEPYGGH